MTDLLSDSMFALSRSDRLKHELICLGFSFGLRLPEYMEDFGCHYQRHEELDLLTDMHVVESDQVTMQKGTHVFAWS